MKKRFLALLAALCMLMLAACGSTEAASDDTEDTVKDTVQSESGEDQSVADAAASAAAEAASEDSSTTDDAEDAAAEADEEIQAESTASEEDIARLTAYRDALETFLSDRIFPDGTEADELIGDMEDNEFAICDVDNDDVDELIIRYTATTSSGMTEGIYEYRPTTGAMITEATLYPSVVYYDNWTLKAYWSHNQGLGGSFWPYTVYYFDIEGNSYTPLEMVDAWDSALQEEGFPSDVDVSGSGIVYYIMVYGEYDTSEPVDETEYNAWVENWQEDAQEIEVPYQALTQENIQSIG